MVYIFFQIHNELMFHFVLFFIEFSKVAIFCLEKTFFLLEVLKKKKNSEIFSQYRENSP
jgi:hypothetical protein